MDGRPVIAAIQKKAFWVWSAFLYIFIVTPLICVILASFNQESVQSVPPLQWSLRWYGEALRNPNFVRGALTSLVVATVATIIARRGLPFFFVSGYGLAGRPEAFIERPALQKPVSILILGETINAILATAGKASSRVDDSSPNIQ